MKAGKIGGIGLSEVSAATIEKAAKVTKLAAVEVELSLWSTDILSNGVARAAAAYNIPIVAYVYIERMHGKSSANDCIATLLSEEVRNLLT